MSTEPKNSTSPGYDVGHGRPPVHSRFQKGQSGNPRGRRSREKSMPAAVLKALHSKVVVTENGERKSVPRIEVAARQLANKERGGALVETGRRRGRPVRRLRPRGRALGRDRH